MRCTLPPPAAHRASRRYPEALEGVLTVSNLARLAAFAVVYLVVDADMVGLYYLVGATIGAVAGLLFSALTWKPNFRQGTWGSIIGRAFIAGCGAWLVVAAGWFVVNDFRQGVSFDRVVLLNAYSLPLVVCAGCLSFFLERWSASQPAR